MIFQLADLNWVWARFEHIFCNCNDLVIFLSETCFLLKKLQNKISLCGSKTMDSGGKQLTKHICVPFKFRNCIQTLLCLLVYFKKNQNRRGFPQHPVYLYNYLHSEAAILYTTCLGSTQFGTSLIWTALNRLGSPWFISGRVEWTWSILPWFGSSQIGSSRYESARFVSGRVESTRSVASWVRSRKIVLSDIYLFLNFMKLKLKQTLFSEWGKETKLRRQVYISFGLEENKTKTWITVAIPKPCFVLLKFIYEL